MLHLSQLFPGPDKVRGLHVGDLAAGGALLKTTGPPGPPGEPAGAEKPRQPFVFTT